MNGENTMDIKKNNEYFQRLVEIRRAGAEILKLSYINGLRDLVVDKYSDQAHFVYELIQNAADAGAVSIRFKLEKNKLFFIHNGTRRFEITNPDTEAEDRCNKKLGDLNAITSYGNSNKINDDEKIGKFGIGFKAVFKYTSTPTIYDEKIFFRLEDDVVPVIVEEDCPFRKKGETAFELPFNIGDKDKSESYNEILGKLKSLVLPMVFLKNVQEIYYECDDYSGWYKCEKECEENFFNGIRYEKINFKYIEKEKGDIVKNDEKILLKFSKNTESGHRVSLAYRLNGKSKLQSERYNAFCFFQTMNKTGMPFIVHAPFKLADNRALIIAKDKHNLSMVSSLADLAADSIVCLKELSLKEDVGYLGENLFDIIPYDVEKFEDIQETEEISFKPVFDRIKLKLQSADVIPAGERAYVRREHAYWSPNAGLMKLFNNEQLRELVDDDKACWISCSKPKRGNEVAFKEYVKDIISKIYAPDDLLKMLNKSFIEKQEDIWLISLYKYLDARNDLPEFIKKLPILLDQNRQPTPVLQENDLPAIFLSFDEDEFQSFKVVYPPLTKNQDVKKFLKKLGVEEPWLKDEIEQHILPAMEAGDGFDASKYFGKIVKYYGKIYGVEKKDYIKNLSQYKCFFRKNGDGVVENLFPSDVYKYDEVLSKYFDGVKDVKYYDYKTLQKATVSTHSQGVLDDFLEAFGLTESVPKIIEYHYDVREAELLDLPYVKCNDVEWVEEMIEGLQDNLDLIEENKDVNKAYLVWGVLLKLYKEKFMHSTLEKSLLATATVMNGRGKPRKFIASDIKALQEKKWLVSLSGQLVSPSETSVDELSQSYGLNNNDTLNFLDFLGVKKDSLNDLPKQQREKLQLMYDLELAGFSEGELRELIAERKKGKTQKRNDDKEVIGQSNENESKTENDDLNDNEDKRKKDSSRFGALDEEINSLIKEFFGDNDGKIREKEDIHKKDKDIDSEIDYPDEDDYVKAPFNYDEKIKREEKKAKEQVEQIIRLKDLSKEAEKSGRYTYGWFKALLAMEAGAGDEKDKKREFSIKFGRVAMEPGTEKTLCFSSPDKPIPIVMEEVSNVKVKFIFGVGEPKQATIDAMSVKGNILKVKLRSNEEINEVNLSEVMESEIKVANLDFLLEKLMDGFEELGFDNEFNMKDNLTENIQFVFGPPGTGKTTYLARELITPFMTEKNRILVLTPTNKAADVLAKKVFDIAKDKEQCKQWLIRFGSTNDEFLEKNGVFKDKTTQINAWDRCTVVATTARFAYDYFITDDNKRIHLREFAWDYIIFDEASMIHLPYIVYPLYKANQHQKAPTRFIVAGDPFQIEPVAKVDVWKDENIYKLVNLTSFSRPHTEPKDYSVVTLTRQYRSVPVVGEVYSRFAYEGLLTHNRLENSVRKLNIEDKLPIKSLNIIKFPVIGYEGVYKAKKLSQSPYHVYAALFAVEFSRYIAELLAEKNGDEQFSIGVIAPYAAEASLIDKLLAQLEIPKTINIFVATVHGFQGDECDIILCVFNPPPSISNSPNMFLNKRNIINVAISRAKDYLFIIMPDNETRNVNSLYRVKTIEKLIKEYDYTEFSTRDLEKIMFDNNPTYIEDNTFTTSHQNVNVYGLPEKYYEVRSESDSLDVQIHKDVVVKKMTEDAMPIEQLDDVIKNKTHESLVDEDIVSETQDGAVGLDEDVYVPKGDIYTAIDSYGWSTQELVTIIDIYERYERNGEDITQMIDNLTKLLSDTIKSNVDASIIKVDIGYKMGVFGRLAQGQTAEMAGASDLDYEIWKIYKGNHTLYLKLKDNMDKTLFSFQKTTNAGNSNNI